MFYSKNNTIISGKQIDIINYSEIGCPTTFSARIVEDTNNNEEVDEISEILTE